MAQLLSEDERALIIGALDTCGIALASLEHDWTVGERAIFEEACAILGHPSSEELREDS
jgi:hypothetical protein